MIALAWLASSTWVVPVLGWHHFQFGGKRQNPVTELPAATKLSGFFPGRCLQSGICGQCALQGIHKSARWARMGRERLREKVFDGKVDYGTDSRLGVPIRFTDI